MTQIATCPLTAWYALKLSGKLNKSTITIHLIGSELAFEADELVKWELFLLHITQSPKILNIIFIGPELIPSGFSIGDIFSKSK